MENLNKTSNNLQGTFPTSETSLGDIIGTKVETDENGAITKYGWEKLNNALEMYSDKRYETARYLFVKDDKIVRHVAVSSKTPASTAVKPDDDFLLKLRTYAEQTDSKVIFIHNHPSGYVMPSENDINLTKYLESVFIDNGGKARFLGHAILDHGNYGLYTKKSGWAAMMDGEIKPLSDLDKNYSSDEKNYGLRIKGKEELVALAEKAKSLDSLEIWNKKDWIPAFFASASKIVKSHDYIGNNEFSNTRSLAEKLKSIGRNYNSENVYFFPSSREQQLQCEAFAQTTGLVANIVFKNEDGNFELSDYSGGTLFSDTRAKDISVEDTDSLARSEIERKLFETAENNTNEILSTQAKKDRNMENMQTIENEEVAPDLKTHHRLKEEDVKSLEVISDEDFSDIVDSMLLNDYRNIPNVIRLPNIRADLAERLGLEKDAAFIMKNGISHIRPSRKGKYGQGFSDEEYRMIPQVLREATFAVIDNREKNFQIVFDDIEGDLKQINKIVLNKDKIGNYVVTVGKVEREFAFNEKFNDVVGVGVAPTIYHLRFNEGNPATRLRPSPTTDNSISQEENSVNKKNHIAANFVLEKLKAANIEVIADKSEMLSILESGRLVQKMAAFHGTGGTEKSFDGYGAYVVSVNEGDARRVGMKVASKKYGDAFYVKDQTFETFLKEHKFSPYWAELLKQSRLDNAEELQAAMMLSDTKGNAELERQKNELSTLFKYGLVEHKREKAFVYSIDIPDNDGKNYLPYENPIGLENAEKINGALEKLGTQWQVTRNDGGRQVYFNTLSDKVFGGSQEEASKFLKDAGLVGMRMNDKNYIVFDEKDINVNKRVQFMTDKNGEIYGFAHGGKIYLDPDLMNANTPAHEYTHLWDAYTRQTNPELWEKGKDIFRQTRLWNEVKGDPNYADIADDEDLVLSEVHARICGDIAQRVLERMAEQDGEIARDRAIDWDKEVAEYVAGELGAEIATPELGSESYVSDSIRHEVARNFLAQPMKDLVAGKEITLGREQEETQESVLSKEEKSISHDKERESAAEQAATNFLMQKLSKAGVEVVSDNKTFENMLAYVNEVNICLEMMEEEPYPIQTMDEKDEGLEHDRQISSPPTSSKPSRKNFITSEKACQELSENFEKLKEMIKDSSPKEFLQQLKQTLGTDTSLNSNYVKRRIDEKQTELRVSDHFAHAYNARFADKTDSVVIKLTNNRFKPYKNSVLNEYVYRSENLTPEKKEQIIKGIQDWIQTGEYTDKNYDDFHVSPKERLQQNIAEQLTLGGIKKGVLTGIAALSLASAMPKLSAETNYDLSKAQTDGIVQVQSKNVGISYFRDDSGKKYMKIINYNEEEGGSNDLCIYLDVTEPEKTSVRLACNASDLFTQSVFEEKHNMRQTKKERERLYSSTADIPVEVYNSLRNDELFDVLNPSPKYWPEEHLARKASLLMGNGSYVAQKMIQDSLTYGFVLNNKIYLNPEVMNSNAVAHEYTHIWDKYTQSENPALWESGKDVFKRTNLWKEVIEDENYASIKNNEDLVLSECHARVCGKFAQEVLNKIAAENGNEVREEVVNWDKEVERFIAKEFGMENPAAEMSSEEDYNRLKDFLSQPMKDLVAGKEITLGREQEETQENALSEEDLEYIRSPEFIEKFGDWEKAQRLEKLKAAEAIVADGKIIVEGEEISENLDYLREDKNKKLLQILARNLGRQVVGIYHNDDLNIDVKVSMNNIDEIKHHNILFENHIEAIKNIPEIIQRAIYIGNETNSNKTKHPNITEYKYFATGLKIDGVDYTCKSVIGVDRYGNNYYDQSLSTIEKGRFVDIVMQKNKLGNLSPLISPWESEFEKDSNPSAYYDKRLINICQVPQMKYLDKNLMPTKDAIEAVRAGKLHIEKNGQVETMIDENHNTQTEVVQKMTEHSVSQEENKVEQPSERIQKMATPAENANDVAPSARGLSEERETAERLWRAAVTDYDDPIEAAEAWHNGTDEEREAISRAHAARLRNAPSGDDFVRITAESADAGLFADMRDEMGDDPLARNTPETLSVLRNIESLAAEAGSGAETGRLAKEFVASLEENGIRLYKSGRKNLLRILDIRNVVPEAGDIPESVPVGEAGSFFWNGHNVRTDGGKSSYDLIAEAHGTAYRRFHAKEAMRKILENGNDYELTEADTARIAAAGFRNRESLGDIGRLAEEAGKVELFQKISGAAFGREEAVEKLQAGEKVEWIEERKTEKQKEPQQEKTAQAAEQAIPEEEAEQKEVTADPRQDENSLPSQMKEMKKMMEEQNSAIRMLQEKLIQAQKENSELHQTISMLQAQGPRMDEESQAHERSHEEGRGERPNSETQHLKNIDGFSSETAFNVNQKIPKFGKFSEETKKIEINDGCVFQKYIEHPTDKSMDKILYLDPKHTRINENGEEVHTFEMSAREYQIIINASEKYEARKLDMRNDYDWLYANEEYQTALKIDHDKFRRNTAANFFHNIRVSFRASGCQNIDDAMKCARNIVAKMTPYERKRFNEQRNEYGAEKFDQMLIKHFTNNRLELTEEELARLEVERKENKDSLIEQIKDKEKEPRYLQNGETIGETKTTVGSDLKIALHMTGFDGKRIKTPIDDFKIVKVTENFRPDKAILYSKKMKSSYTIPLATLEGYIKEMEQIRGKMEKVKAKSEKVEKNLLKRKEKRLTLDTGRVGR